MFAKGAWLNPPSQHCCDQNQRGQRGRITHHQVIDHPHVPSTGARPRRCRSGPFAQQSRVGRSRGPGRAVRVTRVLPAPRRGFRERTHQLDRQKCGAARADASKSRTSSPSFFLSGDRCLRERHPLPRDELDNAACQSGPMKKIEPNPPLIVMNPSRLPADTSLR